MRKSTIEKIKKFCKDNDVNVINIRNKKRSNKTRIVVTCLCRMCNTRYDIDWNTLCTQKYTGLCTSCAHKKCSEYKKLSINQIVQRFEDEGFRVITPINKIKPRGKRSIYFTNVDIMNKYGDIYTTNCNNFCSRIDYYRELSNCDKRNEILKTESRLEYKVRIFLDSQHIPYKQQFRFMDCRGEKYPLPFDFCLYYTDDDKRMLIEIDGEQHFRNDGLWSSTFKATQKNDRRKDYYCKKNNIPLLRLRYNEIDDKKASYKNMIIDFIKNNR